MSDKYTLVQEGLDHWINSPNNGGECCQTNAETVDELNRLLARIKRLEEAGDELAGLHLFSVWKYDSAKAHVDEWLKAKEAKP